MGESYSLQPLTDAQRLEQYLHADTKYFVAPVPTPIAIDAALQLVVREVQPGRSVDEIRKLVRLAVFYQLTPSAPVFAGLLQPGSERTAEDFLRSALAIVALAWLGSAAERDAAGQYLQALQLRAPATAKLVRDGILEATDAFAAAGPAAAESAARAHRQWLEREIGRLGAASSRQPQAAADAVQNEIDALEEHLAVNVASVERANRVRAGIDAFGLGDRVAPLAALYVGGIPEATPQVSYWAAMQLLRVPRTDPALAERIALELVALARHYDRRDPDLQTHFDLLRARALRAALYFGSALDEAALEWLAAQRDAGTDPLALRPSWRYPAGH